MNDGVYRTTCFMILAGMGIFSLLLAGCPEKKDQTYSAGSSVTEYSRGEPTQPAESTPPGSKGTGITERTKRAVKEIFASRIVLTSKSFTAGETIPAKYTCDGDETSPELSWSDVPAGVQSFALVMEDTTDDTVDWIVYNIPADTRGLREGSTPFLSKVGTNDANETEYDSPCPASGEHKYVFTLYALDTRRLSLTEDRYPILEKAIGGHILGKGELKGFYERMAP